jgi:hypothetical protein
MPTEIPEDQYTDYPSEEGFDSADGTIGDSPYGSIEYGEGQGGEPALGPEAEPPAEGEEAPPHDKFARVVPGDTLECDYHIGAEFDKHREGYDPSDERTSDAVVSKTKLVAPGVPAYPVMVIGERYTEVSPSYTDVGGTNVSAEVVAYPGSHIAGRAMVGQEIEQWSDLGDDPPSHTTMGHYRYRLPDAESEDPDIPGTEDPVDEEGEPTGEENPNSSITYSEVQDLEMTEDDLGLPYVKTRHNLMGRPGQILRQGVYGYAHVSSEPVSEGVLEWGYVWGYYANDDELYHEIRHNEIGWYRDPLQSGFLGALPLTVGLGFPRGTPWRIVAYAYAPTPKYILAQGVIGDVSGFVGTRDWAEVIRSGSVGLVGFPEGGLIEFYPEQPPPDHVMLQGGGWIVELGMNGLWPHVWPDGGKYVGTYYDKPPSPPHDPDQIME